MLRGGCMCRSVRYTLTGELRPVWDCHCERCRRFSGHHVAATAVAADGLGFDAEDGLAWYEPAMGVFYGFCRHCGSSLFWRADGVPGQVSVMAGTVDQPTGLHTELAIWVGEAADYHRRAPGPVEHPGDLRT